MAGAAVFIPLFPRHGAEMINCIQRRNMPAVTEGSRSGMGSAVVGGAGSNEMPAGLRGGL